MRSPGVKTVDGEFVEAIARRVVDLISEPITTGLPELIDAEEVARILGVRVDYVWALCRAEQIPHLCFGRVKRFRRSAIETWLETRERGGVDANSRADHAHA
jgi:excisionase family DNA binding protein